VVVALAVSDVDLVSSPVAMMQLRAWVGVAFAFSARLLHTRDLE